MKVFIRNIIRSCFVLSILFIGRFHVSSQLSESFTGIQGSVRYGFLLPHRSTMEHLVQGHSAAVELGVTYQMNGSRSWHQDFNLPSVSFVLNYMDFGNIDVLGSGIGSQITTYLPYFRKNGLSFGSRLGAGIGFASKKFNQDKNAKNNAIGSHLNALVSFGFKLEKQFLKNSLALELNMTHFSNGAYKLPNLGLNLPFLGVQFSHYFNALQYNEVEELDTPLISTELARWSWYSQLIVSTKQIYPTGGSNYGVMSLTNFVQYLIGSKSSLEGGIDLIYNQSIIRAVPGDYGGEKNFQTGVYLGYVLNVHKVDFVAGMGRYIYNPLKPNGDWYHKLGTRIQLSDNLSANIMIKAHWAKADYFEYGITYQW